MTKEEFWNTSNVSTFRGYGLENGEVSMTDSEFQEYLDEIYGTVFVCGQEFGQGNLFVDADPVAFRCRKGEHETYLDQELKDQLESEDSSDIEFDEGDEYDLDEEDEE